MDGKSGSRQETVLFRSCAREPQLAYEEGAAQAAASPDVLRFGAFRLEPANARLSEGERIVELTPKAFSVLCHLARRPGLLVTKDELLDAVWGRRFVSESVLKTAVNAIRSALGDDSRQPRFIETVARRGYRFVGGSAEPSGSRGSASAAPSALPPSITAPVVPPQPFIGRAAALAQLRGCSAQVAGGQRQLVLVGGEAGIGKSTLLRQLADERLAGGDAVALGQCVEQAGGGEPYMPVLDALDELARGPAGARWKQALRQAAPTWLAQLPWLVQEPEQASLQRELAVSGQDRMLREFGALLDLATAEQPLLLVLEDLHWSDHATVSLLDYLARRRGPSRWMLAASYRPTDLALASHPLQALRQELRVHKLCDELVLEPFSESEVGAYLTRRLGTPPSPQQAALARALHGHTEGLPLFLANVLDDIEGDTSISFADQAWGDPAHALAALHLPETVVRAIERQIDRLPGELKDLLEAASVLGFEFTHPMLAGLLGEDVASLRERCDGLARRGEWLRHAGISAAADGSLAGRYAFRHALYRRVFYERSAPTRRIDQHLRAAALLQSLPDAHAHQAAADLAHHYEGARDTAAAAGLRLEAASREAVTWRLRAARGAVALHAPIDALQHFARAEEGVLPPDEAVRASIECAELHQQMGDGPGALARTSAALAAARVLGDTVLLNDVLLRAALIAQQANREADAIASVDELLAGQPGPVAEQCSVALGIKADALDSLGRAAEADTVAAAALEALPADARAARARHLAGRIATHFRRGEFTKGLGVVDEVFQLHEELGDELGSATMLNRRGVFLTKLGRPKEAEAALQAARARSRAIHDVQGQRSCMLNLVKLLTDRGDTERALVLLDEGWALSADFESPVTECAFLSGFFYCNYLRGNLGAAWQDAERVLAGAATLTAVYWRVGSLILVSDLFIHLGQFERAVELIQQAVQQTEGQRIQHLWPRVVLHRAWLQLVQGDANTALAMLDGLNGADEPLQEEDLAGLARVRAQARLALGDPAGAIDVLAPFDGAPTQEAWALMLALRLRAQIETGAVVATDVARAHAELADVRRPALESILLRGALVAALDHGGQADLAYAEARLLARERERLLASFDGTPVTRAMVASNASALLG
jgi:DNA-binding winged helix-turn-helix (wHTH) protein